MQRTIPFLIAGALLAAAAGSLIGNAPGVDAATADSSAPPEASVRFDAELCATCHEDQVEAFRGNPHSLLEEAGWSAFGGSCVSCHGDSDEHIEAGGGQGTIFAFGPDEPAAARNGACLECHGDSHPLFGQSSHALAGVGCTSCHEIHQPAASAVSLLRSSEDRGGSSPFDDIGTVSSTCGECHSAQITQFEWNERHRLQEGILDCSSCHNPHEPQTRVALGGFKQEACIDCHTDKGGPFVFEHGSLQVEGCTACHTPHGSPNRHMLTFQSMGELCYSCHVGVPGFHIGSATAPRFSPDANCTNCHSAIHGSNFDPAFLK